jgi:hypothetical protein
MNSIRILAALLISFSITGCNYFLLVAYLVGGPPSIDPMFDIKTGKSMTAHGTTVAVVCYAPNEVQFNFHDIDKEIAKYVTFRLHEHKIKVVNPDRVRAWLDENSEWMDPSEIGRALGVTYVIYIDIQEFSLYEKNSANLFRGRADGLVSVFEMDESGNGEKIFSRELTAESTKYPLAIAKSTTDVTPQTFKREYLSRLSLVIGRLFYEYYSGDDIPDAT